MKYYNFAFIGTCENSQSYCFDRIPMCVTCDEDELKRAFSTLRDNFISMYKEVASGNLRSYKNYKFGLAITTIDSKRSLAKTRTFYINPLNLKQKQVQ